MVGTPSSPLDTRWDPAAEGAWIGERLGCGVVMVPGTGHYPQAQAPEVVAEAVSGLAARA